MYERFTDRARKVMQLASQEAQRFNHEYVGTQHVLLGLVKEGSGVAANVLKNLDVDLRKIRVEVEKIVQSGPDMVTLGKLPQTPRAKKVVEHAIEEARSLNHNYVGTEHLLLGLLREQEGVAAQVLMNLNLKLEEVREEILNLLGHGMVEGEERVLETRKNKRETLRFADPYRDHPLVRSFLLIVEDYEREKAALRAKSKSKGLNEVREQQRQVIEQLRRLCDALGAEPDFGNSFRESLTRYLRPLDWPRFRCVRRDLLDVGVRQVHEGRPVILVGPQGSGRQTLARSVAKRVFQETARTQLLPLRFLVPNHLEMSRSGGDIEYKVALIEIFEDLAASRMNALAIPEFHHCVDDVGGSPQIVEAWRLVMPSYLEAGLPLLAWSTPAGFEMLEAVWPGLIAQARVIELPPLPEDSLLDVVRERMDELAGDRRLAFEDRFAEEVLGRRDEWRAAPPVDPGRALALLEQVVDAPYGKATGMHESPENTRLLELKARLQRLIHQDKLSEAKELIRKIENLKVKLVATAPSPPTRTIVRAQIDAFLRSQPCR